MHKKNRHAAQVVLTLMLTLLLMVCVAGVLWWSRNAEAVEGEYYQITRVVDGDTLELWVPNMLPAALGDKLKLRIEGVDTPEKTWRGKCEEEKVLGAQASAFVEALVQRTGDRYEVVITGWDKYGGRVLGDVLMDGVSLRDTLITSGYARPYDGGKKISWCN